MTAFADRVLEEFHPDLARLWIVADPDGVLLDEGTLAGLRARGFDVLRFEDSVMFRKEYESRYRSAWDRGCDGPASSLILHLRGDDVDALPWDYLRAGRRVSLSLAHLFPNLSYSIVRQLDGAMLPELFDAQAKYAPQSLGNALTKDFVLLHLFHLSPHLILRPEDLWRELLRLHYRGQAMPRVFAVHMERVLTQQAMFQSVPVADLFADEGLTLRVVQNAWLRYLAEHGVVGTRVGEPASSTYVPHLDVPFDHPEVRVLVDSLFLDGLLQPIMVDDVPAGLPDWAKAGVVQGRESLGQLILNSITSLTEDLPDGDASYRDWTRFSRSLGEMLARFYRLESDHVANVESAVKKLVADVDNRLKDWMGSHYSDLPSLPTAKAPVMVHHVPRFLAMQRSRGDDRIALVVFDGLAMDQWVHVRDAILRRTSRLMFDEGACFAWLPTLTSVSRQAIFSGLLPREFADSIETTAREPKLWEQFWQDQGLRRNQVVFKKSLRRTDDLPAIASLVSNPAVKVAGLVIDTVDEIIHGAVLGKRGVASQLDTWCGSGFVDQLFEMLLQSGFHVYLTADHGNVEATGIGRMNQGVASELRGERVRTYRSESLATESAASQPNAFRMDISGLPPEFLPLFAKERGAFVPQGEPVVAHGGMSVEELLVPFVKVRFVH